MIEQLPGSDMAAMANTLAGQAYRKLGQYGKSAACYQRIADNYPESRLAGHSLFMVGRNYEELKKAGAVSESEADAKTKAAYEQLLEDYPDCKAAAIARRWLTNNS